MNDVKRFFIISFLSLITVLRLFSQNNDVLIIKASDSAKYYIQDSILLRMIDSIEVAKTVALKELEIIEPVNPAYRLMDSVYTNRFRNDYEKVGPFTFRAYDKFVTSLLRDSSDVTTDLLGKDMNLFVMESLSNCVVVPPDSKKETIEASKISGTNNPQFNFFLTKLVTISIYKDDFTIAGNTYLSPVNKYIKTNNPRYYFNIEDTIINNVGDTTFIMFFRPLMNQTFNGFVGTIKINSKKWAIEEVDANLLREKDPLFDIKIHHEFYRFNDDYWLPRNFTTILDIPSLYMGGKADTVYIGDSVINNKQMGYPSMNFKRYFYDFSFDSTLRKRDIGLIAYDIEPDAYSKNENYWESERYVHLDAKDKMTYDMLDSLNRSYNLDRKLYFTSSILRGKFPIWKFDLLMNEILRFNNYEGWYLGLGVETNQRLSKIFSLGAYCGYGFRDESAKYGLYTKWLLHRNSDFRFNIAYMHDLSEAGGKDIALRSYSLFDDESYRQFLVNRMDFVNTVFAEFSFRPFNHFKFNAGLRMVEKTPMYDYQYVVAKNENLDVTKDKFCFTTMTAGVTFIYNEKFSKTIYGLKSLGSKYPVVSFNYERGLEGFLGGEYSYNKFELGLSGQYDVSTDGLFRFKVVGGYEDADIPYSNLFSAPSGYYQFTIFAPNSFATMRMNEFVSDRYAYAFLEYDFGAILGDRRWFHPEPSVVLNCGIGSLQPAKIQSHKGVGINTMDKGYYEAGLLINNIINLDYYTLGFGAFYRFGPYSLPRVADNFAYKFTIKF